MNKLDLKNLEAAVDEEFHPLIPDLLIGIDAPDLDEAIQDLDQKYDANSAAIARMNLVGGLRSYGYLVKGGRGGGKIYKVVGWKEKRPKLQVDQWEGESLEVYTEIQSLATFSLKNFNWFVNSLAPDFHGLFWHEHSMLYVLAYEGARNRQFILDEGGNRQAVICQRFYNRPQYRIFSLSRDVHWLLRVAKTLAIASTKPVKILNVHPDDTEEFTRDHHGSFSYREEAIYDCSDIITYPEKYWNKRARSTLRARDRDTLWIDEPPGDDQREVVATWKLLNEHRHRQLAINRDYLAIEIDIPGKYTYGAYRDGYPVCLHLFHTLGTNSEMVSLMNEKSLNYAKFPDGTEVPGGKYGLSDYNQLMACQSLLNEGIRYIQSGGIDGGGIGLPQKKKKFASEFVSSITFHTTYKVSEYA